MDEREPDDREQRERRAEGLRRRIAGLIRGEAGERPPPRSPHEFIEERMREEAKRLEEQSADDEQEPEDGREEQREDEQ
ncbi:MAG: hypothetical protein ICV69_14315 [Thermoleophilaceae bacterium]|nr:hypothetical protein [Thermoleophilaceae bacterium]